MRVLKRRIRNFFALQAILLFLAGLRSLLDTSHLRRGISPLRHWVFLTSYLILSMVFAKAWRTTRKPSESQHTWGTAASLISIAAGICLLWLNRSSLVYAAPGLITLIIGISGFLIYGKTGSATNAHSSVVPQPGSDALPLP